MNKLAYNAFLSNLHYPNSIPTANSRFLSEVITSLLVSTSTLVENAKHSDPTFCRRRRLITHILSVVNVFEI